MRRRPRRPPDGRRPPPDADERRRPGECRRSDREEDDRPWTLSLSFDRRSLSTTLDYTLSLALATIVITGLFIAAGDFVGDQRETVVRTELRVIGERIANDVAAADRLVQAGGGDTTVVVNQSLPDQITGVGYTVALTEDGGSTWVNLSTTSPDVSVAVRLKSATPVTERSIPGGDVTVVYTGSELEVRS